MAYQIIDWIYYHLEDDDEAWASPEALKEKIRNLPADTEGKARAFVDANSDWLDLRFKADKTQASSAQPYGGTLRDALREEMIEEEELTVDIEGEEFEVPTTFMPGRPRAEVSDIVRSIAGETLGMIIESVDEAVAAGDTSIISDIEIPDNLPKSIKSMLRREKNDAVRSAREQMG